MFGQTGNTSFGGFNTAPQSNLFGQSTFGKPIPTTSFGTGTAPVFGSSNTSLFGAKPAGSTTGSLFGTPATRSFGQPVTTQSSFGGFGTANNNTNLFGTPQNANTSLFGASTTPAFGQANKPAGFGFGTSAGSSLFGQPQQPTQQTTSSVFGPSSTTGNTSLFGTAGGFGGTGTTAGMTGTAAKFNPVTGTDTMVKNGVTQNISTRHQCIAFMKEYENKSLEELRLEDYVAGRKGAAQGQTGGLFGATAQASPFGSTGAGTSTATTGFGSMAGGFGTTSQPGSTGLFGKPMTGFGGPATTTSTFAFNPTTTSNLFGTNTQAKPFGATAPGTLFASPNASQPAATGFGAINGTPSTGFGAFGSTQPNQSIGLFGTNKSTFSMPASTANTGFGGFGQAATTNTGTSLFGAKPAGTTGFGTTSTFGSTTAPTFGNSTGFGTAPSTNTSLFNSSFKPTGQTTGFSFGSTPVSSTGLGTNTGLNLGGGSLFGQQKPTGLFGNTGTNTTFNNTGMFGSTTGFGANTNMAPGLGLNTLCGGIGTNQIQQTSGTVPVHQQILALVSAPFGDSPLLKNLLPASGKMEEFLKPTNPTTRTLNSPQYKVATNNNSPKIKARAVASTQYSKKSLFEGLEEEEPTLLEAFQPRANAKRLVLRPKSITNPTTQSSEDSLNSPKNDNNTDSNIDSSVQREKNIESSNKENNQENNGQITNERRISSSWLKSSLPQKSKIPDEEFEGQRSPFRGIDISEDALENTVDELRSQSGTQSQAQLPSNTSVTSSLNSSFNIDKSTVDSTGHSTDSSHELDEISLSISQTDYEPNAAKVVLRRSGYYTIPPLDKLKDHVNDETCIVPHFTVGRKGYGNVYFPDSFDIYDLNLDEIVHFRHKEVIIYPDDEKKPPVGQGLNRRAQVTLDRVWPHDKTVHEPITDPVRLSAMDYEGKLRRVSAKHDTRFLEYRPETGSWVFKVDHFSKYGLSDSDDEDNDVPVNSEIKKLKGVTTVPRKVTGVSKQLQSVDALKKEYQITNSLNGQLNDTKSNAENTLDLRSDIFEESDTTSNNLCSNDYMGEKQSALSPTTIYARIVGTDSHKLQLMKASFFDTNDRDIGDTVYKDPQHLFLKSRILESFASMEEDQIVPLGHVPVLRSNLMDYQESFLPRKESMSSIEEIQPNEKIEISSSKSLGLMRPFPAPVVTPATVVLKFPSEVVPLKESIINKLNYRCIADAGIQMGRMFRVGWGPALTLVSLSTQKQAAIVPLQGPFSQLGSYVSGRLLGDTTSSIVQRLQILGSGGTNDCIQTFKENIERHLRIQLNYCIMGQEGDCPAIGAGADIAALHAHCTLAQEFADQLESDRLVLYASEVWNLCVALWGNLPDIQPSIDKTKHHNVMVRREAFSEWLENVVAETVQREITDTSSDDQTMFSLLTAHKLEEACKLARKIGNHCLALLMAQLGGASAVKELTKQQLALWQETEVDGDLSIERLKLFMLVAGEPLISSKHGTINICERLDWKRALALHLWYICTPTASITDALDLYEGAFNADDTEIYASKPHPEYKEDYEVEVSNGKSIYDLCFHLLKLYCIGNHSLEELLNPLTHTADPLDYRLSWLVQQVLVTLGYSHLSTHAATLTHVNFAAQLETYGLWHWAIFVVLHIQDTGRRRIAVNDLLSRYVELDEDPEYMKREEFLKEELGIPSMWINQAKAIKARATKRYGEAAWYLIQAEQWNTAHELIIEHLAADAIINENYEYMRSLLSSLVPPECNNTISGWAHQGQLLWDYMEITTEIEALLQNPDCSKIGYKLELLQPQLTLLCSKINQFPCPTAKHRLCQAEIAKRTSHLARSLLQLQSKDNKSTVKMLSYLVSQLPLPEDYAQQELRPIVNMCINEIITH